MEAIANLILNSDTAVAFVVTAIAGLFAKWIFSKPDSKFARYQGLIATAVRAAERAIPDDTPNKSAARADHALKAFADGFEKATGAVPDAQVIEYASLTIPAVHQMLEAQGLLKKTAPALLALFLIPALMGCSSLQKDQIKAYGQIANDYYTAPNVAELLVLESTNASGRIEISGITRLVLNTPVPPKTIIPREPTVWESLTDMVKTGIPYFFLYGAATEGVFGSGSTSTVNNYNAAAVTP